MRGLIQKWLKSGVPAEFFRFFVNGGISFFVDYGILYALTEWAGIHYLISSAVGFTVSVVVNYLICVQWVFEGAKRAGIRPKLVFVLTSVAGLGINQLLMWFLVERAGVYYMLAKIFSAGVVMIWNYITKRRALYL